MGDVLPTPEEIAALPEDGGPEFNRLVFEPSPYLLQHARNPVDWSPWGEEAFQRARVRAVPCSCPWATPPVTGVT